MATGPSPDPVDVGIIFPRTTGVSHGIVGEIVKFPDPQVYTIFELYRMVEVALVNVGVLRNIIAFKWFLVFFRHILNDYSFRVGEFQRALRYEGGGGIFSIPSLRDIIFVGVNGYKATRVSEQIITDYRNAEVTLGSNSWMYSQNGIVMNVYPEIGTSDNIVIYASILAADINEDAASTIIPQGDGFTLFEGTLWKCLEQHQKPFLHMKDNYERSCVERRSRVERQLYPSQLNPDSFLRL